MFLPFKDHLKEHFPKVEQSRILVAISGGVDSVVLAHLCKKANLDISLAHCNFHLRGEESEGDEAFVLELADALEVEVFIESFETEAYARSKKISIQMAARELRYHWFEELRETLDFDYIFTAHHANDNLETFLINLVRGTGLEGLTGIPEKNGAILRPLLSFSRAEIEEYAHNSHLKWREDSSNASGKYMRNKIRQEVVPKLLELNPQLLESFNNTQEHLQQSAVLVEDYISALFPRIAKQEDYGYSFRIKMLKTIPNVRAVMYQLFKSFGFTEWNDVYELLEAQPGKIVYSKTHRLIKDREKLLLTTLSSEDEREYEILAEEEVVMLPMGTFQFETARELSEVGKDSIFLDQNKLKFPLTVRKWEEGDHFHPFGMKGKKKLSKFFKDEKLSLPEKENCWLLCSDDEIVWVIGYRADARFGVDEKTSTILKLTFTP
ncbi:tRNA(Ile)-lysidine synthase [Salinimicrobium catena]|uniref:tRNA(Ile)-lysidine synthase n=1 Tax=Salinimicrobium catena TaxID=390640 RepID=A0A1H5LC01_9FLAO|nr:tRNA lysidine(34) synthetase TilS [Salinimicrobium catena]SDL08244.1 tRNA(Ile)-lysidine synthase [Salinimicrobium catena]SEE74520.1 tRNA(Ile)-lysidine synthase [Salinimicrobium catena]